MKTYTPTQTIQKLKAYAKAQKTGKRNKNKTKHGQTTKPNKIIIKPDLREGLKEHFLSKPKHQQEHLSKTSKY